MKGKSACTYMEKVADILIVVLETGELWLEAFESVSESVSDERTFNFNLSHYEKVWKERGTLTMNVLVFILQLFLWFYSSCPHTYLKKSNYYLNQNYDNHLKYLLLRL